MQATPSLGTRQLAILGLTIATALIHLVLGIGSGGTFGILFILNAVGYLVLVAALYWTPAALRDRRSLIRWLLLAFTALTFILYFVFNWPNIFGPLGLVDKVVELLLIILLWLEA